MGAARLLALITLLSAVPMLRTVGMPEEKEPPRVLWQFEAGG